MLGIKATKPKLSFIPQEISRDRSLREAQGQSARTMALRIDSKVQNRVYEDFQPSFDWARDDGSETLILHLEGFTRSQLKVQITSSRVIRVSGERQISENKWRRFYREFPVPLDADTNEVAAKFERGTLYVKFPRLITSSKLQPQPQTQKPAQEQEAARAAASAAAPPPPPPPPPPPKPATREELDAEEAMKKKVEETKDQTKTSYNGVSEKVEQKEKAQPSDHKKDVSEGKALVGETKEEAKPSETKEKPEGLEEWPSVSQVLSFRAPTNYKDAIVGLVGELKKQRKLTNLLVAFFLVLLVGLYVKNLIKSSLGGSKTQEL